MAELELASKEFVNASKKPNWLYNGYIAKYDLHKITSEYFYERQTLFSSSVPSNIDKDTLQILLPPIFSNDGSSGREDGFFNPGTIVTCRPAVSHPLIICSGIVLDNFCVLLNKFDIKPTAGGVVGYFHFNDRVLTSGKVLYPNAILETVTTPGVDENFYIRLGGININFGILRYKLKN